MWLNFTGKSAGQIDDTIKWKWSTSRIFSQHGPEILWFCFCGKLTSSSDNSPISFLHNFQWMTLPVRSVLCLFCLLFSSFTLRPLSKSFLTYTPPISSGHVTLFFIFCPSNPFSTQQKKKKKVILPYIKFLNEFQCTYNKIQTLNHGLQKSLVWALLMSPGVSVGTHCPLLLSTFHIIGFLIFRFQSVSPPEFLPDQPI